MCLSKNHIDFYNSYIAVFPSFSTTKFFLLFYNTLMSFIIAYTTGLILASCIYTHQHISTYISTQLNSLSIIHSTLY